MRRFYSPGGPRAIPRGGDPADSVAHQEGAGLGCDLSSSPLTAHSCCPRGYGEPIGFFPASNRFWLLVGEEPEKENNYHATGTDLYSLPMNMIIWLRRVCVGL